MSSASDRATVVRLLRETIVQLCRANAPFGGGRVEVDGIICITGPGSGQQLVVKVHEILHDAVDQTGPAHHPPPPGGMLDPRDPRYLTGVDPHHPGDAVVEAKRRRVDAAAALDILPVLPLPSAASSLRPHQSALYDYLSRFGLGRVSAASSDLAIDSRFGGGGVKDLSLKTSVSAGRRLN